jgi:DNA-binding winged helix-turn-helix (wHTH) protein
MGDQESRIYRFKSFLLDVEERQLFDGDSKISLTPKTFDVLVHRWKMRGI